MSLGLVVVIVLCLIIAAGLIFLSTVVFKEKKKPKDNTLLVNFDSKYSHMRAIGIVTNTIQNKQGRKKIFYIPKDIDFDKNPNPKEEFIIVEESQLIKLQKGSLSSDKNILMVCPSSLEELDETVANSTFGKAMQFHSMVANANKTEREFFKEWIKRNQALLDEIGGGELSAWFVGLMKSVFKEDIQTVVSKKDDKKSSTSINPLPTTQR